MKRFTKLFAAAALLTAMTTATNVDAQVTSSSYSTGGTAISSAYGRGNTRLHSGAMATGGGYARSTMTGDGRNGGFASGRSAAISHGGVAISRGNSSANGWGARSHSTSVARTVGGFSRSDSNAIANGNWANARSNAQTRTWGTYGRSSSEAIDDRGYSNGYVPNNGSSYSSGYSGGTISSMIQRSTPRSTVIRGRIMRRR
ncbi:hypothetical protein LOC67_26445 [Stieleria sp. JC731]|uniref:hypothetical protein n=1 Tax=Pirellulaceae TaxID=2691357 RepID=UPI001E4E201F|nr:hypothetical protein [Stieleria sp. JC731]MCC9604109.1 hypothetical protein [Stieleria sp. JC731]